MISWQTISTNSTEWYFGVYFPSYQTTEDDNNYKSICISTQSIHYSSPNIILKCIRPKEWNVELIKRLLHIIDMTSRALVHPSSMEGIPFFSLTLHTAWYCCQYYDYQYYRPRPWWPYIIDTDSTCSRGHSFMDTSWHFLHLWPFERRIHQSPEKMLNFNF